MRILITGSKGYIASYLFEAIKKQNYKSPVSIFRIDKKISPSLDLNSNECQKEIRIFNPDLVYHLAAQTSVDKSFKNPDQDIQDNLFATLNLLKCLNKKAKIIFTSSAAIYGDNTNANEEDVLRPQSPYAIHKVAAEKYIINSGLEYVILRLGNVYGRENNKGVFKALKAGGVIFGDGNNTRDYIYIDDVVNALIKAPGFYVNQIYNVGTGISTSVNEIADMLKIEKRYGPTQKEQKRLRLDISKIIKEGWRYSIQLNDKLNE